MLILVTTQAPPDKHHDQKASFKQRLAGKDLSDGGKDIHGLSFAGFDHREDGADDFLAMLGPEAAGHLLTVLAFAEIPLTHVVVERNRKVMQEQQMMCFVFFDQIATRSQPSRATHDKSGSEIETDPLLLYNSP